MRNDRCHVKLNAARQHESFSQRATMNAWCALNTRRKRVPSSIAQLLEGDRLLAPASSFAETCHERT